MALQKTGYRKVRSGFTISRRDSDYMTATYSGIDPDALWEPCPAHSCKHREIPGACREKLWRSDNNRIQDRVRWRQTNASSVDAATKGPYRNRRCEDQRHIVRAIQPDRCCDC